MQEPSNNKLSKTNTLTAEFICFKCPFFSKIIHINKKLFAHSFWFILNSLNIKINFRIHLILKSTMKQN